jgi:hypothetical protein
MTRGTLRTRAHTLNLSPITDRKTAFSSYVSIDLCPHAHYLDSITHSDCFAPSKCALTKSTRSNREGSLR